jgi:hypothetical protein
MRVSLRNQLSGSRAMITNVEGCSEEEAQAQIRYLAQTPIRGIAELLESGRCRLKKGVVSSLIALGSLNTEFGQIGSLVPSVSNEERKFRVSEIVPLLRSNPDADERLLQKIEAFVAADKRGEVKYNVTIFNYGDALVIKDGNKRTIAFYERRKESASDDIEFFVYIVEPVG